jgi:hypothetical protein
MEGGVMERGLLVELSPTKKVHFSKSPLGSIKGDAPRLPRQIEAVGTR